MFLIDNAEVHGMLHTKASIRYRLSLISFFFYMPVFCQTVTIAIESKRFDFYDSQYRVKSQ